MEINQIAEDGSRDCLPANDEWLLRLNFRPEHIVDGAVIVSAISLEDLRQRGFSVDREHMCQKKNIVKLAEGQKARLPEKRHSPYLSRFLCGNVREEIASDNEVAFTVNADPIAGNDAHAHIISSKHRSDSALRQIRVLLLRHLQNLSELEKWAV